MLEMWKQSMKKRGHKPGIIVLVLLYLILGRTVLVIGQDTQTFPYPDYMKMVLSNHPMAKQAQIQIEKGLANLLEAKGAFDPQLSSSWKTKLFDDKRYYNIFENELEVPTRLGFSLVAGYENNDGTFLDPEQTTTNNGLWSIGIEANLLQGFVIDSRRAMLQQAEIYQTISANDQQIMLNKLLLNASAAYLNWLVTVEVQSIIEESIQLGEDYFEATKSAFQNGDKPAIDTLEASLIIQDRRNLLLDNTILLNNARQMLENFLWEDDAPIGLRDQVLPDTNFTVQTQPENQLRYPISLSQIPELQNMTLKLDQLSIERRLKVDKLKPKLSLNYHPLLRTNANDYTPRFERDNYRWGVKFSTPLRWRATRGAIQKTELKIQETQLKLTNKENEIQNKIDASIAKLEALNDQLTLQQQNVTNYLALLDAERTRFEFGESSVFLMNKREQKYLEGRIKLAQIRVKIDLATIEFLFYTNNLQSWLNNL